MPAPILKPQKLISILWVFLHPFVHQLGVVLKLLVILGSTISYLLVERTS